MVDLFAFDINSIPLKENSKVDGIRLAFHKKDITQALVAAKKIIASGYSLFLQPMVTKNYNEIEFISLVKHANALKVYAFYIVDSFGSMSLEELRNYTDMADKYLDKEIKLGYHSHNNMQLAFSNAIDLCSRQLDRSLIIDSSIYGMGRGAGNLNTELIADYLNMHKKYKYEVMPLLEVIDEILAYYFKKKPWGFSLSQYLSASLDCHPNYASYLIDKKTTYISDIKQVLSKLPIENKNSFNRQIVDDLYKEFLFVDKSKPKGQFNISTNNKILLIASGSSVREHLTLFKEKVIDSETQIIALNHKPQFECDYYFFSNQQRFDKFTNQLPLNKQVITTNIRSKNLLDTVISLKEIAFIEQSFVTNVALLMINYLIMNQIKEVEIAGLDGYQKNRNNYVYDDTNVIANEDLFEEINKAISKSLQQLNKSINIHLITPSIFEKHILS